MPQSTKFQIKVNKLAFLQLQQLHFYISKIDHRPLVADEVVNCIERVISKSIADNPYKFPECAARRTHQKIYRQAVIKNFKIIFRIIETTVTIIGIVHSSRSKSFIKRMPIK